MLIFNNFDLEQYIITEDIDIQELAERRNYSIDVPNRMGDVYTGYKYGQKRITIPFKVDARTTADYTEIVRLIKRQIHTDIPAKLYLPDDLGRYYYAVVEDFTCTEVFVGVGDGSLTFICYDPYAYSEGVKVIESDEDKVLTVTNKGSAETYPLINIAFQNEAHFAQVTNWDGKTILVGSRPSVENESVKPNTVILSDPCESTEEWLPAGNVVDAGRVVEGSATVSDNGNYITSGNFGSSNESTWHGCAIRRNLGENLSDFEVKASVIFKARYGAVDKSPSGGSTGGSSSNTTSGSYKTTVSALNFRSGAGTGHSVICTIPKGTTLNIIQLSSNKAWGRCTYKSRTGWVSMSYLSKVDPKGVTRSEKNDKDENKMGRIEIYGFDKAGQKLFKVLMRDSTYWYTYGEPEAWIGGTMVLDDKKSDPKPKTTTVKENDKSVAKNIEGGAYGEWNNFLGDFYIKRETISGKQYWTITINKLVNGKVTKTLKTSTKLFNSKYPKGELNNIVVWFGQHKDMPVPDEIGITHLKVSRLNPVTENSNIINFAQGDELEIDCSQNKVWLNGTPYMEKVDIGSEFFSCDSGTSQFACKSDDEDIYVSAVIQERWL